MSQRVNATLAAVVLLFGLFVTAAFLPLPYVTYTPGLTVDVLGEQDGQEVIQVSGHKTYRDEGQLRMTTVYVTPVDGKVTLLEALTAWLSPEEALYPFDSIYPQGQTAEQSDAESAVQMVTSQDAAVAAALRQLGYQVKPVIEVLDVSKGYPADGKLEVRDILQRIGDTTITKPQDVVDAITSAGPGEPLDFQVLRKGRTTTVQVTPKEVDGSLRVGIMPGAGFVFPFSVSVDIDPSIGGPSAGLMFSLAIYDTLTPGSLTDGSTIAGTGTITASGKVGPIGGIQQKIVAARDAGARLFLVPAANCGEAVGAPNGDMELVKATTMTDALDSVERWTMDHDADLPSCETDS
ncbi:MAG: S16 family serine protease [Nocardioidaceae bacterium]